MPVVWYIKAFECSLIALNSLLGIDFINIMCIHSQSGLESIVPSPGCSHTDTKSVEEPCGPLKGVAFGACRE